MDDEPASAVADKPLAPPGLFRMDEVSPTTEKVLLKVPLLLKRSDEVIVDEALGVSEGLDAGDVLPRTEEYVFDASALPVREEVVVPNIVAPPLDVSEVIEDNSVMPTVKSLDASMDFPGNAVLSEVEERMLAIVLNEPLDVNEAPPRGAEDSLNEAPLFEVRAVTAVFVDEPPTITPLLEAEGELCAVIAIDPPSTSEALEDSEAPPVLDDISSDVAVPVRVEESSLVIVGEPPVFITVDEPLNAPDVLVIGELLSLANKVSLDAAMLPEVIEASPVMVEEPLATIPLLCEAEVPPAMVDGLGDEVAESLKPDGRSVAVVVDMVTAIGEEVVPN